MIDGEKIIRDVVVVSIVFLSWPLGSVLLVGHGYSLIMNDTVSLFAQ